MDSCQTLLLLIQFQACVSFSLWFLFWTNPKATTAFTGKLTFLVSMSASYWEHGDFLSGQPSYAFKTMSIRSISSSILERAFGDYVTARTRNLLSSSLCLFHFYFPLKSLSSTHSLPSLHLAVLRIVSLYPSHDFCVMGPVLLSPSTS